MHWRWLPHWSIAAGSWACSLPAWRPRGDAAPPASTPACWCPHPSCSRASPQQVLKGRARYVWRVGGAGARWHRPGPRRHRWEAWAVGARGLARCPQWQRGTGEGAHRPTSSRRLGGWLAIHDHQNLDAVLLLPLDRLLEAPPVQSPAWTRELPVCRLGCWVTGSRGSRPPAPCRLSARQVRAEGLRPLLGPKHMDRSCAGTRQGCCRPCLAAPTRSLGRPGLTGWCKPRGTQTAPRSMEAL